MAAFAEDQAMARHGREKSILHPNFEEPFDPDYLEDDRFQKLKETFLMTGRGRRPSLPQFLTNLMAGVHQALT
ncbi:hypothetical protein V1264_020758 [Littorina saxatilis]|uniref:Uncharacterized protein n=1 Tax=Littorina saxatilis TaxID=31220 RepID=A0AAN9GCJ9_9CAEN